MALCLNQDGLIRSPVSLSPSRGKTTILIIRMMKNRTAMGGNLYLKTAGEPERLIVFIPNWKLGSGLLPGTPAPSHSALAPTPGSFLGSHSLVSGL